MTIFRTSPHDREILRLALPALGALVAEPLYLLADTAVVGHLGTDPLAGLAIASTILLFGYSIFIFLAYGTTAAVSRLLGAGREEDAAHQTVQSMWLAALIGVAVLALGLLGGGGLIRLLGATGAVYENASVYLRVSLLGVPALLVTLAGTGYLRGLQNTMTPLLVALASATGNLALEILFIYGFGWGIAASAGATVIAQWCAAVFYVLWVHRAVRHHAISRAPDWTTIGSLARVGRELFIRTMALRGALTVSTAVAARQGAIALGAYQITYEIWNFLALTLDAIAIAGQSMIGRFLGAEDLPTARGAGRRMIWWGLWAGVLMMVLVAAGHAWLPRIFSSDPAVVVLAGELLLIAALLQPISGVVFVLDGLLIGAGDMRFLAYAMVAGFVVFAVAAAVLLVTGASVLWLWSAIGLLMLTRLVTLGWRWRGDRWAITGATR